MKRILTVWLITFLLLAVSVSSCLASNHHAVAMDDFIPAYQDYIADYALLGASWDADNFTLLNQDKRIGSFDYDGLMMECELYKKPKGTGNSLRMLSVKVPLDTKSAPDVARPGTEYRIIALIATLEHLSSSVKNADQQSALSAASDLYGLMSEKYSVLAAPKSDRVSLYRGQAYNYFYAYEDSSVPAYFVAEIVQ